MIDEIKMRLKKSARPSKRKNDKPFASDCSSYTVPASRGAMRGLSTVVFQATIAALDFGE
jgi:hypothetical protein